MSWEGFYQALCEKGHEYQIDGLDDGNDGKCPCGAECVFWNLVDQTNDDGAKDYLALVEKEPATLCTCEGCGNRHLLTRATFHIPEEGKGHRVEPGKFSNNQRSIWARTSQAYRSCPPDCDHRHNPACALSCYED